MRLHIFVNDENFPPEERIRAIDFSPVSDYVGFDSQKVVEALVGDGWGAITAIELNNGRPVKRWEPAPPIVELEMSREGKWVPVR